ncbi:MAG: PAS domain-containing protein [Chloroflexi bacterium]|nr:PAS domain-containing protein [Chloroflexota bacterium]
MDRDFNILQVNPAFAGINSGAPGDFLGKNFFEQYPDPENEILLRKVIDTGEALFIREKPLCLRRLPQGEQTYWDCSIQPVKNQDGRVDGLILSMVEQTQRVLIRRELEKSQENLEDLLSSINGTVWRADPESRKTIYISKQAERFLGYPIEEWENNPYFWYDHIHPDDRDWLISYCDQKHVLKQSYEVEFRMITAAGGTVWVRNLVTYTHREGVPNEIRGLAVDITQRKTSERLIKIGEKALNAAANSIMITDQNGKILWTNPAVSKLSGYSSEETIGKTPRLFSSHLHGTDFYKQLWDTILSGDVWHGEIINRRKDGSLYTEEQTITPVLDDNGKPEFFITVEEDITRRKVAEQQIREDFERSRMQTEIYQALAETSPDYSMILDTLAKKMAETLGDICAIHLLTEDGKRFAITAIDSPETDVLWQIREALKETLSLMDEQIAAAIFEHGSPLHLLDYLGAHPEIKIDEKYWEIIRRFGLSCLLSVAMKAHNKPIGILTLGRFNSRSPYSTADQLMVQNLADRVSLTVLNARLHEDLEKAYEQEKRMRAHLIQADRFSTVGRMVASITHEINNPLQTIKNCLYLVSQEGTPGQANEYLDMASVEIERLSDLVAQLRETYRPRAAGSLQPVDLTRLVGEIRQLLIPHMRRHHIAWLQDLSSEPRVVNGVGDQLKQVFLNISLNAIETMASSGGTLRVEFLDAPDRSAIGVAFIDNGPGIAPEVLPWLFEPLFTTKPDGLGLGLSISKEIMEKHKGSITVECPPGGGTIMTTWFPRIDPAGDLVSRGGVDD